MIWRLARAMAAACAATRAISSVVTTLLLANPGPVHDRPDAKAVILGVDDVLHRAIAGEDELIAVAVDADVSIGTQP